MKNQELRIKSQEKISLNSYLLILEFNLYIKTEVHHITIHNNIAFTFNT
jgi:hypothetical protein